MKLDDIDPLLSRARDHLAMAIRLRDTAFRLKTAPGRDRLTQLAALYEQLSLCFLEESCAVPADRSGTRLELEAPREVVRIYEESIGRMSS